jgi:hypothetical protein
MLLQHWPWLLFGALLVVGLLAARYCVVPVNLPYRRRASLLSGSERDLFRALRSAAAETWLVLPAVCLADVVQVPAENPQANHWMNKAKSERIPILLCDPNTLAPIAAIFPKAATDQGKYKSGLLYAALQSAAIPTLALIYKANQPAEELKQEIISKLGATNKKHAA